MQRARQTFLAAVVLGVLCAPLAIGQTPKKKLLVVGAVKGFQHDSVSHAMGVFWKLGRKSGLWDTYLRSDTQLITKRELDGNARNLNFFDAIVFFTSGELDMTDEQKAALLAFVSQDGKGFIGVHSATDTFYTWPEYGEMIGGYFDGHPWGAFDAPIIVEDPSHPIVAHMEKALTVVDEIYQFREFSRDRVRVLMRMDESRLDLTKEGVMRADRDFAVAWVREFGNGRVFYSTFGHIEETWDRPDVQKMWLEAVKWTMKLTEGEAWPRPRPFE